MTRFEIIFNNTGAIFDPKGLVERIIAAIDTYHGKIVVYVANNNVGKFKNLLDANEQVKEYSTQPADSDAKTRIQRQRGEL